MVEIRELVVRMNEWWRTGMVREDLARKHKRDVFYNRNSSKVRE